MEILMPLRLIKVADGGEFRGEFIGPGKVADRMRGEGYQVRGDAEKQQAVFPVELQYPAQAQQILADSFNEAGRRI